MTSQDPSHSRRRRERPPGLGEGPVPAPERGFPPDRALGASSRRFPLTDMPTWLMLVLVTLALPRTVLADLGLVTPESSLLYYILALAPFAAWLAMAVARQSARPFMDFVVLGVMYGLSLVVVHQVLWDMASSLGHRPPDGAVSFAQQFSPAWQELALRGYTSSVAMGIGLGCGLVAAVVAVVARAWRSS